MEDNEPSSRVLILDCRSQMWLEAPRMQVERNNAAANVLDGKIYVAGGCKDCNSSNWMEVFDPKTQTWEPVSCPGTEFSNIIKSAGIDEKVYIVQSYKGLAYKPKEGTSEEVGWVMDHGWVWYSYCVIENVLYSCDRGKFQWYDTKKECWRNVNVFPNISPYIANATLADYGGKMVVLWDKISRSISTGCMEKTIWCAVIALQRRNGKKIRGMVEWREAMLTVHESYKLEHTLSVTV